MADCADCGRALERRNSSGYCGKCIGRHTLDSPGMREKIARSLSMTMMARPELKQQYISNMRRGHAAPEAVEARKKRWAEEKPWIAGNAARPAGSPSRMKAGARISATRLAWCPPDLREKYRFLTKIKRFKAAEAREMILAEHELEMARWRRSIGAGPKEKPKPRGNPFEDLHNLARSVIASVAAEFEVAPEDITGPCRERELVDARATVTMILRHTDRYSFPQIGKLLGGRDHTTAVHHIENEEKIRARNPLVGECFDRHVDLFAKAEAARVSQGEAA